MCFLKKQPPVLAGRGLITVPIFVFAAWYMRANFMEWWARGRTA